MDKTYLIELIRKFKSNTISDTELSILKDYLAEPDADLLLDEYAREEAGRDDISVDLSEDKKDQLFSEILEKGDSGSAIVSFSKRYKRATILSGCAASILLIIGIYWFNEKSGKIDTGTVIAKTSNQLILPGEAKAKLMLEDGSMIDLGSLSNDTLIRLEGYSIRKDEQGELTYLLDSKGQDRSSPYNTIITPKGGEYTLNLPDGTRIWVNSSSELHYPLYFSESKREVKLNGEAYFEVAKLNRNGKQVPFFVYTNEQRLEVLGTSFNINSYGKTIETTLVEGKVKLSFPEQPDQVLAPNQQAVYAGETKQLSITQIDPFYVTAWKNGSFAFEDTPIIEVMEQLARWYDVEVSYNTDVRDLKFTGTISKYEHIAKILQVIELTEVVKFKIDGRRVVVM